MLVLSRKVGEEIIIDENIRVQVIAIQGNKVRLGFVAPSDVAIVREEIAFTGEGTRKQADECRPMATSGS